MKISWTAVGEAKEERIINYMSEEKDRIEEQTEETTRQAEGDSAQGEDSTEYEKICIMCHRPESKAGKMIEMPGQLYICADCMQRSFRTIQESKVDLGELLQRMPPNISMIDLSSLSQRAPQQKIKKKKEEKKQEQRPLTIKDVPPPHMIKEELDAYVIGQERAKKIMSVGVYNHYKRILSDPKASDVEIEKSNMLMIGPTGSGKTYLVQTLAKLLNVPLALTDATSLTEAGYIGDDIESVVSKLLAAADNDVERAEHGIIFIDEIDKIAKKKNTNQRDVSGEAVQQGMLKLLEGSQVEDMARKLWLLHTQEPQVRLRLEKGDNAAWLSVDTPVNYQFFGSRQALYAMGGGEMLRCSQAFRERVYPLLELRQPNMRISLEDLSLFCSYVLPEIGDLVEINDPQELLQSYIPDSCTLCFYLDIDQDALVLALRFRYDEKHSFTPEDVPKESDGVRRNLREEANGLQFALRYFQRQGNRLVLSGEEEIFDFLIGSLDAFRQRGEVYLSDRLQRQRIRPTAAVGISVSDGLLTLTLDTGDYPPEELSRLYQSMLQKRKYHRLTDGRYLELNGSACEKLAEMTQMLQLSDKELSRGQVTLPAYRGLYLDELLSGSQEVKVHRDSQFRSMVRNFKTLSESDYALPQGLEGVLRPYQQVGFQWLKTLEGYGFGGILADEMGLGKTLQMIAFLATVPYQTVGAPSLVVCPASLIYNWGDELARFAPQLRVQLILGSAGEREALRRDGVDWDLWVTSYELLRQDIEDYGKIHFYCCVLDEAQHIKNAATLASKAVKAIDCTQRFVLTGTPIENRLSELWNLFDFLMPGYLYTNHAFREKLEKPVLKAKSPEALEQLRRLVRPFVLRRLKGDVLKELPPKEEHIRRVSLSQEERKLYCACVQAAVTSLGEGQEKLKILAALTRLRQLCCDPELCFENYTGPASKLDACVELCEAMVENGHQILLFSQFTSMLERIRARLDDLHISSFTLQGSTSKEKRAALVKAFNGGEASVFLISLKAGGTGLNLTAADVVIHYDPWWNQAAQDQATDRAHRMGQQAHVQVYKLIAKDTIEEKILELQEKKTALLDAISGCEEAGILNMSGEELISLLKENL